MLNVVMLNVAYADYFKQALYAEPSLFCMLLMLSVANKPFMLSVIILSVIMLSVTNKPSTLNVAILSVVRLNIIILSVIMLNVIMLSAVMVNVVAPIS
jgi:hypothetical protein